MMLSSTTPSSPDAWRYAPLTPSPLNPKACSDDKNGHSSTPTSCPTRTSPKIKLPPDYSLTEPSPTQRLLRQKAALAWRSETLLRQQHQHYHHHHQHHHHLFHRDDNDTLFASPTRPRQHQQSHFRPRPRSPPQSPASGRPSWQDAPPLFSPTTSPLPYHHHPKHHHQLQYHRRHQHSPRTDDRKHLPSHHRHDLIPTDAALADMAHTLTIPVPSDLDYSHLYQAGEIDLSAWPIPPSRTPSPDKRGASDGGDGDVRKAKFSRTTRSASMDWRSDGRAGELTGLGIDVGAQEDCFGVVELDVYPSRLSGGLGEDEEAAGRRFVLRGRRGKVRTGVGFGRAIAVGGGGGLTGRRIVIAASLLIALAVVHALVSAFDGRALGR